jgi:hypothetical protein
MLVGGSGFWHYHHKLTSTKKNFFTSEHSEEDD